MECERCYSVNIEVEKDEKGLIIDNFTLEQYETTTLYIKCNNCGHKFLEVV